MDADQHGGGPGGGGGGAALGARVVSVPAGRPFVDGLAAGLLARWGDEPLALARVLVLLPTRRAIRSLSDAFLRVSGGEARLLPRMQAIGDVDEEELAFDAAAAADVLGLPPAVPPLRRTLLLAALVRRDRATAPAQAAQLAEELGRLLDRLHTNDVDLAELAGLAPEDLAQHWQQTLDFLHRLGPPWRGVLAAEGTMEPAERRGRLLRALAERWVREPPAHPVVAAGSTGSIPAAAELIATVAGLPQGLVVLPGLDAGMDEASWAALDETHPQFTLSRLLDRLGVDRAAVPAWPVAADSGGERARLLSEAMRPAATSDRWRALPPAAPDALAGLARVDCETPQAEAGVIALALRRQLEAPQATAALVTPDRALARRVAGELARWGIEVDDSAGEPLSGTPPGVLLRLAAEAAAEGFAPVPLLALLKHPLAWGGMAPGGFRAFARRLETAALRGPRPAAGLAGLAGLLDEGDRAALGGRLGDLAAAAAPFAALLAGRAAVLAQLIEAHVGFAEWLARDAAGRVGLWDGEAGEQAAGFVADLRGAAEGLPPIAGADYPGLLDQLMAGLAVGPRWGRHPRLATLGPLEARLQQADLVVLGGLNEGTWPAEPVADPWLNRAMQRRLGLPPPELRIGLAAHDFVAAASAPRVLLTRAGKVDGSPTVPSRWLARLDAVLAASGLEWPRLPPAELAAWQAALDRPDQVRPVGPPAPRPPLAARPRQLSVTRIETWRRDPYAIFARHVLRLRPLDALDAAPDAADRGGAIHAAHDAFVRAHPGDLPDDALARLVEAGRRAFEPLLHRPGVAAFWWPRFERVAAWFVETERARRSGLRPVATEVGGRLELAGPGGPFVLTAEADRIDAGADGALVLIDYKTGAPPSAKEVERGDAPQLPLEAAIAAAGGFDGVAAAPVAGFSYWQMSGGFVPGRIQDLKVDAAAAAATALAGLAALVAAFDDPATPYLARPRPHAAPRFSDYGHLARVAEWSAGDGGEAA